MSGLYPPDGAVREMQVGDRIYGQKRGSGKLVDARGEEPTGADARALRQAGAFTGSTTVGARERNQMFDPCVACGARPNVSTHKKADGTTERRPLVWHLRGCSERKS